ncbi:hypothetical protein [Flavobacterium covae]|uniref:hypothetical protein n=1 Tax=Flavobacterium covae TaxID=2906076 RepID=UPI0035E418EB
MEHAYKLTNLEEAMNRNAPSLGAIRRDKGDKFSKGLVMVWLVYINDILNLNKPLTEDQIEWCATQIISDFAFLKITDLTLLTKRIISGQYGEFFESLNTAKVLRFFKEYSEERMELAESISLRDHLNHASEQTFNYSQNIERIWNGSKGFNSNK